MTTAIAISPGIAFENLDLMKRHKTHKQSNDVYLWGVRGKTFVLITKQNGFLKRIWHAFLAKLQIIKTDKESRKSLKDRSIFTLQAPEAVDLITQIPHWVHKNATHYLSLNKHAEILQGHQKTLDDKKKDLEELRKNFDEQAKTMEAQAKVIADLESKLEKIERMKQEEENFIGELQRQLHQKDFGMQELKTQHESTMKEQLEKLKNEKERLLSRIFLLTKENEALSNTAPKTLIDIKEPIDIFKYNFEQWRIGHEQEMKWVIGQRDHLLKEVQQLKSEKAEANWAIHANQ